MPLLQDQTHRNIAFWGMTMIALGLPLSIFLMSVGLIVLIANWLLEGGILTKLKRFFTDPLSIAVSSLFLFYCLAMLWSTDLAYGLKELKTKIPLMAIPLVLFTGKLPIKERIHQVLLLFVVACLVGILFGMARYFQLPEEELMNKRQLSVFISHIRFGLMLVLAFFILAYFLFAKWSVWSATEKLLSIASLIWILWFIIILEAFTAYLAFAIVSVVAFIFLIGGRIPTALKLYIALALLVAAGIATLCSVKVIETHYHEVPFNYRTQAVRTLNGNMYSHSKDILYRENGHRVWNFVCWPELEKEWPTRSEYRFDGFDKKEQEIKYTVIRYMTSKGLKKDSAGIAMLTDSDIKNIEAGYTNHLYTSKLGIARRIDQMLWAAEQYSWNENANNSSTIQRWVYFDVGLGIWKENPTLGVGAGDVKQAYQKAYAVDSRGLEERFQGISHNQYLTVGIALGVIGFLIFCFSMFYPLFMYRKDFLFVVFTTLILVSFLTDNTFSRQSGVLLFAFFNALLVIRKEFSEV